MTQMTLNIEDQASGKLLRALIKHLPGISIAKPIKKRKSGLEKALDEARAGKVTHYDSVDDLINHINSL